MDQNYRENPQYLALTALHKSINTLVGILTGIAIDKEINDQEVHFLADWVTQHRDVQTLHPFNELIPVVRSALKDGIITEEEREDLLWLCKRIMNDSWIATATDDLRHLHGMLGGIAGDSVISEEELLGLRAWLKGHQHLERRWPYDEVVDLIRRVMRDKKIDAAEHIVLMKFFTEFFENEERPVSASETISDRTGPKSVFAPSDDIEIEDHNFCFTGDSPEYERPELQAMVLERGGYYFSGVSRKIDYLVVGKNGSPDWQFSTYGRKIEKAVDLQHEGYPIKIITEDTFLAAVRR